MVESLDDLDDSRVRLATGVDGSSVTMSLALEEQRVICNRVDTQQKTKYNTTRNKHSLIRFNYKTVKYKFHLITKT